MPGSSDAQGRAYGMAEPQSDLALIQVGPGTPGGELLRRYWQPIAVSSDATIIPKEITRFGEKLILFRNKQGDPGLLYPRCIHRGASLLYGKVDEDGIRCCYHGWKFGVDGACLDQPCEPKGGVAKQNFRQPWYPVVEKWGAIWAYMGPADRQPLFPSYSNFENLDDDEEIEVKHVTPEMAGALGPYPVDHNWFQFWENAADQYHVPMLHAAISGPQFKSKRLCSMPDKIEWFITDEGGSVVSDNFRTVDEGEEYLARGTVQAILPNIMALPPFFGGGECRELTFAIPLDDMNYIPIRFERVRKGEKGRKLADIGGLGPDWKMWYELTPEEHQIYPSDYEAQASQGGMTFHSEEHLVTSDRGVAMLRKIFRENCERVKNGGDPVGVAFREEDRTIPVQSRTWSLTRDGEELPYVNEWPDENVTVPAE